jgi:hypothetical protein
MAICSAYFDESGHSEQGPYVIVAGCVADVGQWVHFEREWLQTLAPLGTTLFHTHEFNQGLPPFDLSTADADDLFFRLIGIICRRVEKTFSQAVRLDQYQAINDKYVFAESYGFPYPSAARSCIGLVEEWAKGHNIPQSELMFLFENGAKHKGQIEWLCQRDGLHVPVFGEKTDFVPMQAADLIAWCHNLYLTKDGIVADRYERALDRLATYSHNWGVMNLGDPDKIPTILSIARRDPRFKYKCTIIKHRGQRRAVTHYWPKDQAEPAVDRKTLALPDVPALTHEQIVEATARYESLKT